MPAPLPNTASASVQTATRHELHGQYACAASVEDFHHNLHAIRTRINAACQRAGRDPASVRLLPVSKTIDEARLRLAYAAGCRTFGENKVQEAQHKAEALGDLSAVQWAVIGHLQTNKAKYVARFAHEFHALDSLRVAEALNHHLQACGRTLDVLVQVNTSGEASKSGLAPDAVATLLQSLPAFSALRVRGFMTLAMLSADPARVRACFALLRNLRDSLQPRFADMALQELSMGMSGDYEIAIEEGATIVRVGQALFGARAVAVAGGRAASQNCAP